MRRVEELAVEFRKAIESAQDAGETDKDNFFIKFPTGCCGPASDLLAQYLFDNGILTKYVCGTYYYGPTTYESQSHAWLLIDDIIVDITGDQFKYNSIFYNYDKSVHVGNENEFYELFEVEPRDVHGYDFENILTNEQKKIYKKVIRYIKVPLDEKIKSAQKKVSRVSNRATNDEGRIREIGHPIVRKI